MILAGPGHANDSPMLPVLLEALEIPRVGPGRARTRPDALLADKAYSARSHRALLRRRGIKAVIPEPSDQIGHRQRRGSRGGRPVNFDRDLYKHRNVIERGFNTFNSGAALPAATTSSQSTTAAAHSSEQSSSGPPTYAAVVLGRVSQGSGCWSVIEGHVAD